MAMTKTVLIDLETVKSVTRLGQELMLTYYNSIDTNLCKEIFLSPMSYPEPKYKFSRAKWYKAKISTDALWRLSNGYNDIIEWCTDQFGKHPANPDAWSRWKVGIGYIYFRDEVDYILYQLKWS